jgi:hypothetical protein
LSNNSNRLGCAEKLTTLDRISSEKLALSH